MKRLLLLALAVIYILSACEKPDFLKTAAEKATPAPTPPPTPPKGDWMWKNYKNPLDPKKK
jgi:hypothetical protein